MSLKTLEKKLAYTDKQIAEHSPETIRKARAVESLKLHVRRIYDNINIESDRFEVGSLDDTNFAATNHKLVSHCSERAKEASALACLVNYYEQDADFFETADKLKALARDRSAITDQIKGLKAKAGELEAAELAQIEAEKAEAAEAVEKSGRDRIKAAVAKILG